MAVTKTLTGAIPANLNSKVQQWNFVMQYEEGADATYFASDFIAIVPATEPDGTVNFTPKAEGLWTLAQLTALCPTAKWDKIFASQYDSAITNPPDVPVSDPDYVIPS